jgi:DNA polymerase I
VSVWAENDGHATIWRRVLSATGALVREQERFRPWILVERLDDFRHLGAQRSRRIRAAGRVRYRELDGPGELRYCVSADSWTARTTGAADRRARRAAGPRPSARARSGTTAAPVPPPEEQYLVATGRTYFRDLAFDDLRRLQFDLETTGLDRRARSHLHVAVRHPEGRSNVSKHAATHPATKAH